MPAVPSRAPDALTGARRVRGRLAPGAMFPAGLPGYRSRMLPLATGERVRVVEAGPESGRPVLLVCGWGCSVWDFNRTIAPLAHAGFRAIAIDPRGHGLSDMPMDASLYATEAMVAHLLETLDALDLAQCSIIGHSMGGALAVHTALRSPSRVRSLVLIGAVGFGDVPIAGFGRACSPPWMVPVARRAFRRWVVLAGLRLLYETPGHADERNVDEYWAPSQFAGFVPAMRELLHRFRWSRFTDEEIARIDMPCLIVRGARDGVVRPGARPLPIPPAGRELVVAASGHLPHDEVADRVNAGIIDFLEGRTGVVGATGEIAAD